MWHGENFRPRYVGASWNYVIKFMVCDDLFNLAVANEFLGSYIGCTPTLWRILSMRHAKDICKHFRTAANEMVAGDLHLPVSVHSVQNARLFLTMFSQPRRQRLKLQAHRSQTSTQHITGDRVVEDRKRPWLTTTTS